MSVSLRNNQFLIPWRIHFLPLKLLRLHEEVCREHVFKLYHDIVRDKILIKPLLVEDRYYIVLDGHHRYAVLKMLRAKLAPVFLVDYDSPLIEVYSWRSDWNVTKEMVVDAGLSGRKLPYKTSKHVLKDTVIPEVKIPLKKLMGDA